MKKIVFITLCFCFCLLKAQPPTKFYTRFGGNGDDVGNSVIQALDGQYVVAGSTSSFGNGNTDVYLAKVDTMGWHVLWERSYGGYNNDIGTSVIQIADSGYVISGYTNSFGSGGYDLLILRTDKNGNLIWQKAFGGMDWDYGYDLKQTPDLGFVICGSTYSYGYGKLDAYIVKVDINGVFQWQKTYGGSEDDYFKSMVLTYNGFIAYAGATSSYGDINGDGWLFKTDLLGDSTQSFRYGNSYKQFLNDIAEHPVSKNFYLCGAYDKDGRDSTAAWILGIDENGTFLFQDIYAYKERKDEQFLSNARLKNNDFFYIRRSNNTSTDKRLEPMISQFSDNFYVAATKYGSFDDDELYCITQTRDKGFICVGYTKGWGANLSDVFLLKLDSNSVFGAVSAVSVEEINNNTTSSIKVFPTITNTNIIIENNTSSTKFDLKIQNSLGITVLESTLTEKLSEVDVSKLPSAVYFVSVSDKKTVKTFKIIKTN